MCSSDSLLRALGRETCTILSFGFVFACGCAKVDPSGDFQRAAQLIIERTGSDAVYDPQAEELIEGQVDSLLADGLTVEEAVRVALLNNRGFQSAFAEIGVSRAEVVQSALLSNPSLLLLWKFPEGGGRPAFDLGFAQEIADLWQIPVRKQVAQAQLESTVLDVANRAINLAADVRLRCYEWLALQQAEAAVRENLQLAEQSLDLAQRQFEAGAASRLDVNLARANTIDVRLELIGLEREQRVAESALARLLNLSGTGKAWSLNDSLPPLRPMPTGDLLSLAMGQRFDAQVAAAQAQAAERELRREYLRVFPSVQIGFELERSERRALPGRNILADTARESIAAGRLTVPSIESRAQREQARREIIDAILGPSLALTLPIWDQNQAQIALASFRVLQRRKDYEDLLDQVANEVERAAELTRNAESLVRFYDEEALPQARESVEGARRVYEAGQQSILVLIEAQESLILRRRAYVRALGEHAAARVELERAVGGRLPEAPATQPAAVQ